MSLRFRKALSGLLRKGQQITSPSPIRQGRSPRRPPPVCGADPAGCLFWFSISRCRPNLRRATMPTRKSSGRKYSKKAGKAVEREMHKMKRGTLKSGGSGKKVKSRKQAIAIGLSEARKAGAKVPKKKS